MSRDTMKKIVSFILAFFTCFSVGWMLKSSSGNYVISNSIFSIFIFALAYKFFYDYVLKVKDRRLWCVAGVLGTLFSFGMVIGSNVLLYDASMLNYFSTWIYCLGGIPLFAGVLMYLLNSVGTLNKLLYVPKLEEWVEKHISLKKTFFISWIFLFLSWLVGLIASYPGMYGYDSVFQLNFYIDGEIDLWHPLAHTYIMGFCIETIGGLLGSREAGMFVYSIVQVCFLAAIFALVCYFIAKKKCPAIIRIVVLILMALLPVNAIMSFSCTKDVPFAGFLCILTYVMMRVSEDDFYLSGKRKWVFALFTIFGVLIFRNQGIYVVLLALAIGIFLLRKQWKKMLILLLSTCLMFGVYSGPITEMLHGVEASRGVEEMLSVPIMQLSRAYCNNADELTMDEKELIKLYIPNSEYYDVRKHGISDGYKETFNSERFKQNPIEFVGLWLKVALKAPVSYIDAFARLSIGLWYPDMNYRDPDAYHPYWEYENTIQKQEEWIILERTTPSCLQWLADYYYDVSYNNSYQKLPIISMLFSGGFYIWLLFFYIAWCVYNKRYKLLFPASLLVLYWLTLLLGPVVLYRYIYPVIISMPILLGKMIAEDEK